MASVDERIIQMKFDNRQFERNIAKSTKSIEELKKSMDFEQTSRGMNDFVKSANAASFNSLEANLQKLTEKFTGLGDAGEYVLSRVRASLEGAAASVERFMKSISIDQISVGQGKYDSLNKAVQTILATGKYDEKTTYGVMERLMEYTDQTSYSFGNMANYIPSFTSVGQSLQGAERAMEGIANMSAKAGQGVNEANIAMSAFSKALGSGFLGKNQWDSLVLSAHTVTEEFRQTLMDTAVEVGTLKKEGDKYYTNTKKGKKTLVEVSNLENTLNQQWADQAVIMATLEKYHFENLTGATEEELKSFAGTAYKSAQRALTFSDAINAIKESVSSSWMQSFRHMFGDVTEAMETFTNIADRAIESIEKIGDFRNKILKAWADQGGRKSLLASLLGGYSEDAEEGAYGLLDMLDGVGKMIYDGFVDFVSLFIGDSAYRKLIKENPDRFAAVLGVKLQKMTEGIQTFFQSIRDFFTEDITMGGKITNRLEIIHEVVDGIVGALAIGIILVDSIAGFVGNILNQLEPSFLSILGMFGLLGETTYNTAENLNDSQSLQVYFQELAESFRPLTEGINSVVAAFTEMIGVLIRTDEQKGGTSSFFTTVGNVLKAFADIVVKYGTPVMTFIREFFESIEYLIQNGITAESLKHVGEKLAGAFRTMLTEMLNALPESFGFITKPIKDLFGLWEEGSEDRSKSFFTFLHNVFTEGFKALGETLGIATDGLSLTNLLNTGLGFKSASNFLGKVVGFFKGTNLYSVITAFLGVATVFQLFSLVRKAKSAVDEVGGLFETIQNKVQGGLMGFIFGGGGDEVSGFEAFAENMQKITQSLGIVVGCIVLLGALPTPNLIKGVVAVGLIMAALVLFAHLMDKHLRSGRMRDQFGLAAQLIGIAAAIGLASIGIGLIALALLPYANQGKQWLQSAAMFGAIITGLGALIAVMSVIPTAGAIKSFFLLNALAKFAIGLAVLSVALKSFASMSPTGYLQAIGGLGAVLGELLLFMGMMSAAKISTKSMTGFIGFAASIGLLIFALQPMANWSTPQLYTALGGLGGILMELVFFMKLMDIAKVSTKSMTGFIGFAASIGLLILALQPIADWSTPQLYTALGALGGIMMELLAFMKLMDVAKISTKSMTGFIGFAASMGLLMLSLQQVANWNTDQLYMALGALGGILMEILLAAGIMDKAKISTKGLGSFIGFAASMMILVKSILPLADLNTDQLYMMLGALGGILAEIALFSGLVGKFGANTAQMLGASVMIAALGGAMLLFAISLNEVKGVDWTTIAAFAGGLSVLMIAMAGALAITSKLGSFKGILIFAAGLAVLIGVLGLLGPWLMGQFGQGLADMAAKLTVMGDMLAIFSSTMNNIDEGAISKGENNIGRIKTMLEGLKGFDQYSGGIQAFSDAMYALGTAMAIYDYFTSDLSPESTAMTMITTLAGCAGDLEIIEKMNLTQLATQIGGLGGAMMLYAQGAAQAGDLGEANDDTDVTAAVTLLRKISEAFAEEGGFTIPQNMPEPDDIGQFGVQLSALAGALVLFEQSGSQLGEGTEKALKTLDFFADIRGRIKKQDFDWELIREVNGETTVPVLQEFGNNISQLGLSLKQFAESTSKVNEETGEVEPLDYDKPIEALDSFVAIKERLPNMDGLVQLIVGHKEKLSELGTELAELGSGISTFSTLIEGDAANGKAGFDETKATSAITVLDAMVDFMTDMSGRLPKVGGLGNAISTLLGGRETTFKDIGDQIGQMGDGLGKLAAGIGDGFENESSVTNAMNAVSSIINMMISLADLDIDQQFGFGRAWMYLGELSDFIVGMTEGFEDIAGNLHGPMIENFVGMMSQVSDEMAKFDNISFDKIGMFNMFAQALSALTSINPSVDFELVGQNIAAGVASGISKGTSGVIGAAVDMAVAAYNAAVAALKIGSPSKLFAEIGGFVSIGFANGITDASGDAVDAATGMSQGVIDTAKETIATMSRILAEDTDANPTITPVLDLSNAVRDMNSFEGNFGRRTIGIDTSTAAGMAGRAVRNINGETGNQNGINMDGIYERMNHMAENIAAFGERLSKIQIVLDSGVVAGGVTDDVDGNLGRKIFYAGRRN